ncbi:unnamed protein product, partial [marine sediment metagenome]
MKTKKQGNEITGSGMVAPTGAPDLDILSRLEGVLDDVETSPDEEQETQETKGEEPKVELPEGGEGEEEEPIAAEGEKVEEGEVAEGEEEPSVEAAEVGEEEVRTMSDLAKMFEVEESELLNHLEVESADGTAVPLAKVIESFRTSPAAEISLNELNAQKAATAQEAANLRAKTDEQVKELAVQAQVLLDMTSAEFNGINWKQLELEDPQQYLLMKNKQAEHGQVIQRAIEKMRGIEGERSAEAQQNYSVIRANEIKSLHAKKPEWADQAVASAAMSETNAYLQEMGLSTEEINGLADHRQLLIAWEAAQYRKLKNQT